MIGKIQLGDVLVTDEACTNPYTYVGPLSRGEQRVLALRVFQHDGFTNGLTLWYAPPMGGARKITAAEVDWRGMR